VRLDVGGEHGHHGGLLRPTRLPPREQSVGLDLLVADTYPDMLQGASSDLLKGRSGKAVLTVERW
jgi:hypothetical protein